MASITEDSAFKVIEDGIKVDIASAIENERWRAAVILIYSAMDSMAFLNLPAGETEVKGQDFIDWTNRYIRFPCKEQLTGEDLYGARCAMLHTSRVASRMSRQGKCRMIGYADLCVPEIYYEPHVSTDFLIVSVSALKTVLFEGINKFLIHAYSDKARAVLVNARIEEMVQLFPAKRDNKLAETPSS